jgi:broad specificity phosphatase PhoE
LNLPSVCSTYRPESPANFGPAVPKYLPTAIGEIAEMPPTVITVRHAQGHHNVKNQWRLYDAVLTPLGHQECAELSKKFPHHDKVDLLVASPLRRTIQTAVESFGPVLTRKEVPFLLQPKAQEVSTRNCNVGFNKERLKHEVRALFEGQDIGQELETRIDYDLVVEGWNSKEGYWGADEPEVKQRAADLRAWRFDRPEQTILLVTHGAFLHYFTEDWEGFHPSLGSAYRNCEVREFTFTPASKQGDAHIKETAASRKTREGVAEKHAHVEAEISTEGASRPAL